LFDAVDATRYGYDVATVKLLLENGADVNLADNEGKTPLLIADKLEVLQLLLAHGAHVNAKDKDGKTALIKRAQGYDEDGAKVKLLLDHGADVNARDNNGNTALTYASSRTRKHSWYSEKQIEVLKQHGAKE
jgi:ankyrin repeat protein